MTRFLFVALVVVSISFTWFGCNVKFKADRNRNIENGIVEQYCHTVHRFSVDRYLDCKSKEAQDILIDLTDKATNNLSLISREEIKEATKGGK